MNQRNIFQLFLILVLLITFLSGRALYYDELDDQDRDEFSPSSNEDEGKSKQSKRNSVIEFWFFFFVEFSDKPNADMQLSKLNDGFYQTDDRTYDSYEEREFYQRALSSSSHASRTISPHTRQAIIDLLQKALDQGWRPNLKHYIPATRFGRHRR